MLFRSLRASLERKNIFDLYDVDVDYLNSDEVKFANLGSLNSEIYYIQRVPGIGLAVVSSYSMGKFVKERAAERITACAAGIPAV